MYSDVVMEVGKKYFEELIEDVYKRQRAHLLVPDPLQGHGVGARPGAGDSQVPPVLEQQGNCLLYTSPIDQALTLTNQAVAEALDGLPAIKMHCSVLAEEAIKAAVKDYYDRCV